MGAQLCCSSSAPVHCGHLLSCRDLLLCVWAPPALLLHRPWCLHGCISAPPPLPFNCQTALLPFLKPISLKHPALAAELSHALCWGPCSDWHRVAHGLFPQSPPWQLLADSTLPCKQSTVLQTDNRIWHWEHDSTVEQRCNCGEKLRLEAW